MTALAPILQGFFTDKLIRQRRAGPNTIAAYRDTCRLLLEFAFRTTGHAPSSLDIAEMDAGLVTAFLTHLETARGNTAATRNARLAAIHSLFRYAALHSPEHAEHISRVLAIPPKRCDRPVVCFLTAAEIDALLAAPDRTTRLGRRDHALLLFACQTGLRVSELIALTRSDIHLDHHGAHVRCHGLSRVRDKPCYAERWFMPSYPASGVDLPCGRGGSRLLSPELLGIIRGRRGRRAACRVPGSGRCWCPAVPCARALVL